MNHDALDHPPASGAPAAHAMTSPWPPVASIGALVMFFSFIAFFAAWRALAWPMLAVGVALTLVGSIGWWIDIVKEQQEGPPPPGMPGQSNDFKLGWILFIASEMMFFSAFFGFLFYARFRATTWPPEGVPLPVHDLTLPMVMTVILVTSGLSYTFAESALLKGMRPALILGLAITSLLGLSFLGIQAYEWSQSPLSISDGQLGSAFYMLTGFHGIHVLVGLIFIVVNLFRAIRGHFTPQRHFGLKAAGWYWHFVDVVWIVLVLVLYVPLVSGGGH